MPDKNRMAEEHEDFIADLIGGHTTIASGAKYEKLDAVGEQTGRHWRFLAECKSTFDKGYRLTQELWEHVVKKTYERGADMRPMLAIRFYHEQGYTNYTPKYDLVVLDAHDYAEMRSELEDKDRKLNKVVEYAKLLEEGWQSTEARSKVWDEVS